MNGRVDTTPLPQLVTSTLHLGRISPRKAQFVTGPKRFDLKMKVSKMKIEVGRHHFLTTTISKP